MRAPARLAVVFVVLAATVAAGLPDMPSGAATARTARWWAHHLRGVGDARQIIAVTNTSWTSSHATVRTFVRRDGTWHARFTPFHAHIGRRGFGRHKHEGDEQTPVGSYGVGRLFGTAADPGVRASYRRTDQRDFWVDESASPYYNRWRRGTSADGSHAYIDGRYTHVEHLYVPSVYDHAFVIRYNVHYVPGRGSAIFFHHTNGLGTSGCVAVADRRIRALLRWIDKTRGIRIVMGPESAVLR